MTARRLVVALAFAAGLYATWIHDPVHKSLTFDNQIYYYIAVEVADGVPPHVSLIDHKHQLPTMLSGWAIHAGRWLGVRDLYSARAISTLFAGILTATVAWLGAELGGIWAGVLATLALIALPGMFSQAAMGLRPQVFMATFMTLALVAFGKRRRFAAGLAATAAFLCWQPAALIGAGLAAAAMLGSDRLRALRELIAGALSAVLLYEAYFLLHGAVGEQLRQSYLMAAHFGEYSYPTLRDSLGFFLWYGIGWREDSSVAFSAAFLVALVILPLVVLVARRRVLALWRERPAWPAFVACAYLTTGLTFLTHEGYPDMFFVEPLIAVAAGVLLAAAAALAARITHLRAVRLIAIVASIAWLVVVHVHRRNVFPTGGIHLTDQYELAKEVDILADDYGSVWAVGCPHLLAFAHRQNFLPLGLLIDLKVRAYVTRDSPDGTYLPLRDGRLPGAILSARGGLRTVMPWLPREYRRIENRSFQLHGIQVWVRRLPRPAEPRQNGSIRRILR